MRRIKATPRQDWPEIIKNQGLVYNITEMPDGSKANYWNESAYYSFSLAEIERLEAATAELFEMCIAAGDHILETDLWRRIGIPEKAMAAIRQTWFDDDTPSVYGRFDLAYDGTNIKLLEFNADTPTALLESAVVQWYWLQDTRPKADQWNSLHERLVAAWQRRLNSGHLKSRRLHVAASGAEESGEDYFTTVYMQETAMQAGLETRYLHMEEVGLRPDGRFVDDQGAGIEAIFKLYPWEWMLEEKFADGALASMTGGTTQWIEPIYKMLWSNKGILAALWEIYPNHPLLLESHLGNPGSMTSYAAKPLLGREGQGVQLMRGGKSLAAAAGFAALGPRVYQGLCELPDFEGNRPVLGAWVVDGEPAGLGIRESDGPITDNLSRFVPHLIED